MGSDSMHLGAHNSHYDDTIGSEEADYTDGDDDLMDDEFMDKISSSPSIDDGTCDWPYLCLGRLSGVIAYANQRISILNLFMLFIISSQLSRDKRMRRKVTPWFSWTIATAIGGLYEL